MKRGKNFKLALSRWLEKENTKLLYSCLILINESPRLHQQTFHSHNPQEIWFHRNAYRYVIKGDSWWVLLRQHFRFFFCIAHNFQAKILFYNLKTLLVKVHKKDTQNKERRCCAPIRTTHTHIALININKSTHVVKNRTWYVIWMDQEGSSTWTVFQVRDRERVREGSRSGVILIIALLEMLLTQSFVVMVWSHRSIR